MGGRGAEGAEDDDAERDLYEIVGEVQTMEKIKQALREKVSACKRRWCAAECFVCSFVGTACK